MSEAKFFFVTNPLCEKHVMGYTHPESPARIREVMNFVNSAVESGEEGIAIVECKEASLRDVELVHDADYVELVRKISEQGGGSLGLDNEMNQFTYGSALTAVGGAILATNLILDKGGGRLHGSFAVIRPPGHHAGRATGRGFCFFNNIAIAATKLIRDFFVNKIAIVDVDNHFGDGTSELFYDKKDVFYISLHAHPQFAYPYKGYLMEIGEGEGEGYNVNIPLLPGIGDQEYLEVVNEIVVPILEAFKPEIILVSAGFDGLSTDPIGSLALTPKGYGEVAKKLYAASEKVSQGKLSSILEGGYDLKELPQCIMSFAIPVLDPSVIKVESELKAGSRLKETENTIKKLKNVLSPFWPL